MSVRKIEEIKKDINQRKDEIQGFEEELRAEEIIEGQRKRAEKITGISRMANNEDIGKLSKEITIFSVFDLFKDIVEIQYGAVTMSMGVSNISLADITTFFAREKVKNKIEGMMREIKSLREKLDICTDNEIKPHEERIEFLEGQVKELEQSALKEWAVSSGRDGERNGR